MVDKDKAEPEISDLQYQKFGKDIWDWFLRTGPVDGFDYETSESVLQLAKKNKMSDIVPYSKHKHGYIDCDEGDDIWVWGDFLDKE